MYDIAIIGGGINGCGIARDAMGRNLKVLLLERGDIASATSSASTKLIHGGLRYLEQYEFRLVREALAEREVLWGMAPHIVRPLRFILPHHRGLRPAWMLRLGLFIYDRLGGRSRLPASCTIDLRTHAASKELKPGMRRGFAYYDCWVDDSRLVLLNALDAAVRGADVRLHTELTSAHRRNGIWSLQVTDLASGEVREETARILVNAAGPWLGDVMANRVESKSKSRVRLVKGSHIVVPRIAAHDDAYIFQNSDRRVVFAIPYEQDFTLIGTTDVEFSGDPSCVVPDQVEVTYLCHAVSAWLERSVSPSDVVWSFAGVRSLFDDGDAAAQDVTRDFTLEVEHVEGGAPLLSVFGGKITTYRRLAEAALLKLAPWLKFAGPAWTRGACLPGGDLPPDGFDEFERQLAREYPWLDRRHLVRMARAYGTRIRGVLADCSGVADLGHWFGADLYEREVVWLMREEWARTAEDVLWRRSKLGLRLSQREHRDVAGWIGAHGSTRATRSA